MRWPWPWPNDLGMTLTSFMTLTTDKLNQVKTDVQEAKLAFSKRWPWPWPNDHGTQTWPRCCQDVPPHQKWSFYVNWFKSYSPNRQTDTQTDTHTYTQTHTHRDTTKTLPLPHTREVIIFFSISLLCNTFAEIKSPKLVKHEGNGNV